MRARNALRWAVGLPLHLASDLIYEASLAVGMAAEAIFPTDVPMRRPGDC